MADKTKDPSAADERVLKRNDDCCIDPERCGRAQTCLVRAFTACNPELYDENIGRAPPTVTVPLEGINRGTPPIVVASAHPRDTGSKRTYENKGTSIRLRGIAGA